MKACSLSDYELLLLYVSKKSHEAFQVLLHRHEELLQKYCIRLMVLRNRMDLLHLAEDIVQKASIKLIKKAKSLVCKKSRRLLSLLMKIVSDLVIDEMRKKTATVNYELIDTIAPIQSNRCQNMELEALQHCLERLSEMDSRVIMLVHYESYSTKDLSKMFGRKIRTVQIWKSMAELKLRNCIQLWIRNNQNND